MLIAIRDDDLCYFTKPEQLEFVYGQYWDMCPVTLSAIPFVDGRINSKDELVPYEYKGLPKQYPIGQNKTLINYLKEQVQKKRIGISMHGYTHFNESDDVPEFELNQDYSEKVNEGKSHLEKTFGFEITVFTPPNNSMSSKGAKAVINAGMNIVIAYGFYPWERPFNYKTIESFFRLYSHFLRYKRKYPYPKILNCGTHQEHPSVAIGKNSSFEQLKENFEFLRKKDANICIATHYAGLCCMPDIKKIFCRFLDYIISNYKNDVQFVTIDKLFD